MNLRNIPAMHSLLGLLIIASYFTVTIANPDLSQQYPEVYVLQFLSCGIGAALITYPVWHQYFPEDYRETLTLYCLLYLIYANATLMFMHSFSSIAVVSFLINILVIGFFGRIFMTVTISLFASLIALVQYVSSGYLFTFIGADIGFIGAYGGFALAIILMSFIGRYQNEIDELNKNEKKLSHLNDILNNQISLREENLKHSLNLQNEILQNVNHEIRAPMMAIKTNAEILDEVYYDVDLRKNMYEIIQNMKKGIDRFCLYAANMLDLSKYNQDQMLFDIKPGNFRILLEEIADEQKNILLKIDNTIPDIIEFDELKMRNLFKELIRNARHDNHNSKKVDNYNRTNNIVEIFVKLDKDIILNHKLWKTIKIQVKDSGIGIPEEEIQEIFEPFKLSSWTKTGAGGKGLGLAIVKEIVRGHLGKVWAENNLTQGASIFIILPIIHPKDEFLSSNSHVESEQVIDLRKIITQIKTFEQKFGTKIPKVLMIDDQISMINSGSMTVKSLGYEFIGLKTGGEAIKYINSNEFDCDIILLDMILRDITAPEVMKQVAEKLALQKVSVIIQADLSSSDDIIQEVFKLGAKSVITKPYSRDEIREVLRSELSV